MKIFGIGFSGYIGAVVAERLMEEGHELVGLARTEETAELFREWGIKPVSGSFADAEVAREAAVSCDATFILTVGGFLTTTRGVEDVFTKCVNGIIDSYVGTGKTIILIAGIGGWLENCKDVKHLVIDETMPARAPGVYAFIQPTQDRILAGEKEGFRGIVVAPAGVYGRDGGYIGLLPRRFECFHKHGVIHVQYPCEAVTSYVHVDDLADLFVLALNKGKPGGVYLGASDTVPLLEVARAVSRACGLKGRVEVISKENMEKEDGWVAAGDFNAEIMASGEKARKELGWCPRQPGVLDEMERLASIPDLDVDNIYPCKRRKATLAAIDFGPRDEI